MYLPDSTLEALIQEDVPYFDLTTHALGICNEPGEITFFTRQETVVCATEEVSRIFAMLDIRTTQAIPSGERAGKGMDLIAGKGPAGQLLIAWKVCQNLLEYGCGIAEKAHQMVQAAKAVNPKVEVVCTRKNFPGTKAICVNAALYGGVYPHRLGLSESVLVFDQHMAFLGGFEGFCERVHALREKVKEKALVVEVKNLADALRLAKLPIDGIQVDKMPPAEVSVLVRQVKETRPDMLILAAGGIQLQNIAAYAATGADLLVTTSVYNAGPADVGVKIQALDPGLFQKGKP